MALDIYVGSLTRYYSGDWQNVAQTWAQEQGIPYHTVRPDNPSRFKQLQKRLFSVFRKQQNLAPSLPEVQSAILAWRQQLSRILVPTSVTWPETVDTPYFTDRPAWDGYVGLLLWAAYDEHPHLKRPHLLSLENWHNDPAFVASTSNGFQSNYPHLLKAEFWLPISLENTFNAQEINGHESTFGSNVQLEQELERLNGHTWRMHEGTPQIGSQTESRDGIPLETAAQLGYAIFHKLTQLSIEHGLPMKLDY